MAKIDLPLLPPRLYRYRDVTSADLLTRELDAIAKAYLWFSQYRELNDPMEGFYGVSPWLARQTAFNRLSSEILNHKRAIGMCCFSDTHDNELMWAHYAGNYSGICVAYSTRELREGRGWTIACILHACPMVSESPELDEIIKTVQSRPQEPFFHIKRLAGSMRGSGAC